ncbi:Sigma-E factor regulatory protein RseB precursor [Pseudoalteromonas sp. P1-9]|uniref:MucB/RseB C-terminal domain-containing protein n=1 Tax=Pseudoalteromonas sp. P1-9 TaxID=1710354 RepID=UPI0006D6166C|nr:MucB/RseB C-terminal domain-containing protein [Pseudoalteromonas sp. P1-9]KPV97379.1 Sigma-E factor regulatory protein RseB precursor [Pseudoalteromonas sp. P1-9]
MRIFVVLAWLVVALPSFASEPNEAKQLLLEMANTVKNSNFTASFVVVKGRNNIEPYAWRHANHNGTELEHLSLLDGAGVEMLRVGNIVTYFEPQNPPYSLNSSSLAGPIPSIIFNDISELEPNYHFAIGGKSRISGRVAQLVRIESKDQAKFNYWLWLDEHSKLPLKTAYVSAAGEIVEQLQMTNVSFSEQPSVELIEMSQQKLPSPVTAVKEEQSIETWQVDAMPTGFALVKSERQTLNLNGELADYYLYSDGLIEVSVFIQRPLASNSRSKALSAGATTVFIHQAPGYEVSVIGQLPPMTAKLVAESVQRAN